MKNYYWTCPDCGANLDPDEQCDCGKEKAEETAISTAKSKENLSTISIISQEVTQCQI